MPYAAAHEDRWGIVSNRTVSTRGVRVVLFAVVALASVLLSMAAMHASMIQAPGAERMSHASASASSVMAEPGAMGSVAAATPSSDHAMGDMNLADCLLLGMVCFLTAAAVLLLALVIGVLRSLLRPRALAQSLLVVLGRLRPPEPPSLFVLSISRT